MKRNKESKARIRVINMLCLNKDEQHKYDFEMKYDSYCTDYKIKKIVFVEFNRLGYTHKEISKIVMKYKINGYMCTIDRGKRVLIKPMCDIKIDQLQDMFGTYMNALCKIGDTIDSILKPFQVKFKLTNKKEPDNQIIYVSSAK